MKTLAFGFLALFMLLATVWQLIQFKDYIRYRLDRFVSKHKESALNNQDAN